MIVVLDTNALIQIFGRASPFTPIREALRHGQLELAISAPILLEYEEVILHYAGRARWEDLWSFLKLIDLLHRTIRRIGADYRFHAIYGETKEEVPKLVQAPAVFICEVCVAARVKIVSGEVTEASGLRLHGVNLPD